jgi:adenylosuccinate synthase
VSGKLSVVVGGQYGSEGKGAIAGYLCTPNQFGAGVAVRVAGPNAGHSAVGFKDGKKWALRQIPVAAVTNPDAELVIAAGSEVDPEVLAGEVAALDAAGYKVSERLTVDPEATVITENDKAMEVHSELTKRVGSTGKGIGAARAARLMRAPGRTVDQWLEDSETPHNWDASLDTATMINRALHNRRNVLIEGTQGYGLGLHAGDYPYCTSSDCRAIDFLAMAGIAPWSITISLLTVWVVCRVYPIRVAGNSGPMHRETTWEKLGLPEERTTVTQKIRRVGEWDGRLVRRAIVANGGSLGATNVKMALTMVDQMYPDLAGVESADKLNVHGPAKRFITQAELDAGSRVRLVGTGPNSVVDLR